MQYNHSQYNHSQYSHSNITRSEGTLRLHIDSGIRSGQDVLRAVALGANAAYIGRPYLYGLGAYGRKGGTSGVGDFTFRVRYNHGIQ